MDSCPTPEMLEQLHAGRLGPEEEARLWQHIDDCPACARNEPESDDRYDKLVAHLKGLDLSGVKFGPRPSADVDLAVDRSPRAQPDAAPINDQIPHYTIVRELHRGGQGVVYEAIQESTHRPVALKVLLAGRYATPEAQRRFEREIEIVAGLKHPDIVSVFDSGRTLDGRQYCVMDLVAGSRLDEWLRTAQPRPKEALALFARVCEAVHYAHQRGVIHRDLKPSNILIEPGPAPKILDFGLARPAGSNEPLVSRTGQIVGTLPYMSPEQTRGRPDEIDVRTDVYSLGVVLYELMTGAYPYPVDGDLPDVIRHITETEPASPSRVWRVESSRSTTGDSTSKPRSCPIDDDIETIVFKALSKEKDRRYQTALELAQDIRHHLAGEPIAARRDSTWYVLRKSMTRHRGAVGFAVALFAVLIAWGAAITVGYGRERALNETLREKSQLAAQRRDSAVDAEERAEERFEQVHKLAQSFLFDFHDEIKDLSGATPVREFVVSQALDYLGSLADLETLDDPRLVSDIMQGYMRVGDVQGGLGLANLGDTAGALASYERAAELAERWTMLEPENPGARLSLADAHMLVGDMLSVRDDIAGAMEKYETSRTILVQTTKASDTLRAERMLARLHHKIANVLRLSSRYEEAAAEYAAAGKIIERLAQDNPDNSLYQNDLAQNLLKQVHLLFFTQGDSPELMGLIDRAMALIRVSLDAEPENSLYLRDLSIASDYRAETLLLRGDVAAALTQFQEGQRIAEQLYRIDPENMQAYRDVLVGHNNLGRALMASERHAEAVTEFEAALKIAETLLAGDSQNTQARRDVGRSYYHIATAHSAQRLRR